MKENMPQQAAGFLTSFGLYIWIDIDMRPWNIIIVYFWCSHWFTDWTLQYMVSPVCDFHLKKIKSLPQNMYESTVQAKHDLKLADVSFQDILSKIAF